jgi:hypothetical protein
MDLAGNVSADLITIVVRGWHADENGGFIAAKHFASHVHAMIRKIERLLMR